MNNLLNLFIYSLRNGFSDCLAHYSYFYNVSCLSSFITGEVAKEKFWKNHRVLLHPPTISYPNFSSVRSLQVKKWISWLLAHCSYFYIFQFYYWRNSKRNILKKSLSIPTYTHYIIPKLQPNSFTITDVINFNATFSSNNLAAYFFKTRNFTITNLKRHNLTSHALIDMIFFF